MDWSNTTQMIALKELKLVNDEFNDLYTLF